MNNDIQQDLNAQADLVLEIAKDEQDATLGGEIAYTMEEIELPATTE